MSQLLAKHYPTVLLAKAADHTYVECGAGGKGWSCWGGKTGGSVLNTSVGSSKRADLIAAPNERAGITCYLINGVCHQAANRILLPAGITVMAARGYALSSAIFGAYGRPGGLLGTCRAPFNQHPGITGDLPQCAGSAAPASAKVTSNRPGDVRFRRYLRNVLRIYSQAEHLFVADTPARRAIEDFHVEHFALDVRFKLGALLPRQTAGKLKDIRRSTERARLMIEQEFSRQALSQAAFVEEFNEVTAAFQYAVAGVLTAQQYRALFGLRRGEAIILADPNIVEFPAPRR